MAIEALSARGTMSSEIARLLRVTVGAARYRGRRMAVGAVNGAPQRPKPEAFAAAIELGETIRMHRREPGCRVAVRVRQ